jgi:hypothetical protein
MPTSFEQQFQNRGVRALNRHHAVEVTYSHDGDETPEFMARRSDRSYSTVGLKMRSDQMVMMRDYVIQVSDLRLNNAAVTPRTGDRITEGTEAFEVSPISDTQPAAELLPGDFEWLVHTKRVDFQTKTGRAYRGEA